MPDSYIPRDAFSGDKMNPGLALFVQNQQVQKKLALEEQLKNAEIAAMMERAKMSEAGATQRNETTNATHIATNAASNEAHAAINRANNDTQQLLHLVPKETVAAYNKTAGTNYPEVDLPAQTFGGLIQADKQAASDATRERIATERVLSQESRADARNKYTVDRQTNALNYKTDKDYQLEQDRQQRIAQGQQRIDQQAVNKEKEFHQQTAAALLPDNIPGDRTTGIKPATDLTSILMTDPSLAFQLADEFKAGGGLPKGPLARKVILPSAVPPEPSTWQRVRPWGPSNQEMNTQVQDYKANLPKFYARAGMVPPTTGSGLHPKPKGTIDPLSPPAPAPQPAATQGVPALTPSAMGGFPSKVGAQPTQPAPGPTMAGPPSTPSIQPTRPTVIRVAPDGRKIEYDAVTKQPLRVVQ